MTETDYYEAHRLLRVAELKSFPRPKCGSCKFYSEFNRGSQSCRKNAPTGNEFPVTTPEEWCAEHEFDAHLIPYNMLHDQFTRASHPLYGDGRNLAKCKERAFAYFPNYEDNDNKFARLVSDIQLSELVK